MLSVKIYKFSICFSLLCMLSGLANAQNVGIGTNKPALSAALDINSTNKGFLLPRVSLDINNNNVVPDAESGLMVININESYPDGVGIFYNAGDKGNPTWRRLAGADEAWLLKGNSGVKQQNYLGTTDNTDVILKRNTSEYLRIVEGGVLMSGPISQEVPGNGVPGRKAFWSTLKYAARFGQAVGDQWNTTNVGDGSFAAGLNTIASGGFSTAFGDGSEATKGASFAAGNASKADGDYSVAMGNNVIAHAANSVAIGAGLQARTMNSVVLGTYNDISNNIDLNNLNAYDRIFQIGNGNHNVNRSNAVTVLRDGRFGINSLLPQALLHLKGKTFNGNSWTRHILMEAENNNNYGVITFDGGGMKFRNFQFGDAFVFRNSNNVNTMVLDHDGNLTISGMLNPSDIRLKTEIKPLKNVLDNINHIQPISYYFKDKQAHPASHQIGFSAQEIEKEFPELVHKNGEGYLSVNYPQMTAVAIQAIKEQQEQIQQQQQTIEQLKKENTAILQRLEQLEKMMKK